MTVFGRITAAFFPKNRLGEVRETGSGRMEPEPGPGGCPGIFRRREEYLRRCRGSPGRNNEMRSTEPVSASVDLFRGVVRQGFRKNLYGLFGKRPFHLLMRGPGLYRVPGMTVFGRVTAAFFPKNGLGQGGGPGGNESGDDPGEPLHGQDLPVQGGSPGYRQLPRPEYEKIVKIFLKPRRTKAKRNLL
jgi:hypothetical protein